MQSLLFVADGIAFVTLILILIVGVSLIVHLFNSGTVKAVENDRGERVVDCYADEDGVASLASQKSFTIRTPRGVGLASSFIGFLTSLVLVIAPYHDWSNISLQSFAPWIFLANWTLLLPCIFLTFGHRKTIARFRFATTTALTSFGLCAAVLISMYSTFHVMATPGIVLSLVEAISALTLCITCLTIPRRPPLEQGGMPVDGQGTVSALAYLLLAWSWDVLRIARSRQDLGINDLPVLHNRSRSSYLLEKFGPEAGERALWRTLIYVHRGEFIFQTVFAVLGAALIFAPELLLLKILTVLERSEQTPDPVDSILLVVGLAVVLILAAWAETWSDWIGFARLGIPMYCELSSIVFAKATRRKDIKEAGGEKSKAVDQELLQAVHVNGTNSLASRKDQASEASTNEDDEDGDSPSQKTINLVSVDAKRVSDFLQFHYLFISVAVELTISVVFLVRLLGWIPSLAGFGAFSLTMPLNVWLSKHYANAQGRLMEVRDRKLTIITEALQGIRQIKFAAQEKQWQDRIGAVRKDELGTQWRVFLFDSGLMFCWIIGPLLLSAVSLSVYALQHGQLSASVAFTAIAVFSQLEFALAIIPEFTTDGLEAWVSCQRIDKYIKSSERLDDVEECKDLIFSDATVAWPSDADSEAPTERFKLRDLNFIVPQENLTVISGPTGSGKSLLLASIIGEADLLEGYRHGPSPIPARERYSPHINRSDWIMPSAMAYVAQIPWIENATIRENVLFGLSFDKSRYEQVLENCALSKDLEILDDGDATDIGFNGINLSGGQKWRISFARALYSRAGILVLDDIFSAVDAFVGKHLFEHALTGEIAKGRTRILVTHHLDLVLPATRHLILLGEGTVKFSGSPESFKKTGELQKIRSNTERGGQRGHGEGLARSASHEDDNALQKVPSTGSRRSQRQDGGPGHAAASFSLTRSDTGKAKKFIEAETKEKGVIKRATWIEYISSSGGLLLWAPIMILFLVHQFMAIGRSYFITLWTRSYESDTQGVNSHILSKYQTAMDQSRHQRGLSFYLGIYLGLSLILSITGVLRYFSVYTRSIAASKKLFDKMTFTVLRAPLRWLDTVPVGRILNRFTADFEQIDSDMGGNLGLFSYEVLQVMGTTISAVIVAPVTLPIALVLLAICGYATSWYLTGARGMKRLESVTKSPILEIFGTTLTGISTIRAYDKTEKYIERMLERIDAHARATWHIWLFNRWIGLTLNIVGSLFATAVAAFVMFAGIDASLAGFVLAFALQYSSTIVWATRFYSEVDLSMNSVERVREYSHLPIEPQGGEIAPPAAWPTAGRLEVKDLVVGYAPDLPPVLKELSFTVAPGTRVGVVGRTGAGKSSLTLALFRFLEARSGSVVIDGVDVSKIPLHDLRSRLAIIPQDPVLFSGTIRSNLDPFDEHDDTDLSDALSRVHLNLPLTGPISESGLNLSQGQRQLLCLARAIVRRPKILVLDEATSAVDKETDTLIQRSIRSEFGGATLLVIAHRLSTIADFEKVLVMDAGKGVEFGAPAELARKKGVFWGLVESSGEKEGLLKLMAEDGGDTGLEH